MVENCCINACMCFLNWQVVLANDRERDDERRRPDYPLNGDLLRFMVNHIARRVSGSF